jgi:hypothetical protein
MILNFFERFDASASVPWLPQQLAADNLGTVAKFIVCKRRSADTLCDRLAHHCYCFAGPKLGGPTVKHPSTAVFVGYVA